MLTSLSVLMGKCKSGDLLRYNINIYHNIYSTSLMLILCNYKTTNVPVNIINHFSPLSLYYEAQLKKFSSLWFSLGFRFPSHLSLHCHPMENYNLEFLSQL